MENQSEKLDHQVAGLPSLCAGAAMISSASGCISRSSSEIRAWATSQPVRWIATASEAVLSSTSARAARIRGAQVSQASMCSRKSFSNRSPSAISVKNYRLTGLHHCERRRLLLPPGIKALRYLATLDEVH